MRSLNQFLLALALLALLALPAWADEPEAKPTKAEPAKDEPAKADTTVKVDTKAPEFELMNQDGKKVKLSDYSGKNLVLVFSRAHW